MPRDFIDKEDNYNEKDYRVVMGRFSSSLRGKAIILFLIYFVILALYFLMNIYVYFPHVSNDYEKVVSKNHIRRIIENLNYKLNIRMALPSKIINIKLGPFMRDIVENNISSELLKDWHARFYSDGVFNNRSSDAHVVGLYSMDLRLIYGEYNKLQEDDTLVLDPSDFPTLLRGVSEESKEYMYDLSKRNGYANVLNGRNNEPSFLVSMVPVLDENETEVGYFLWAGELRRAIQEISETENICLSFWNSEDKCSDDVLDDIRDLPAATIYGAVSDLHYKTVIHSSFDDSPQYRKCWGSMKYGRKKTGGYLKLTDGVTGGCAVFRVEDDRIFGNYIASKTKVHLYCFMFVFVVGVYAIFYVYYEFVVLWRIRKLRDSLSDMLVNEKERGLGWDGDDYGDYSEDETDEDDEHHAEARKMKLDELGTLKFIARKRIEVLKTRREASIRKLIRERERTDILVDSENMFSLSNGRVGRGFLQNVDVGKYGGKLATSTVKAPSGVTSGAKRENVKVNDAKVTLMSVINNPYGFEMFKDYCTATNSQNYLFFVLDVSYLRSLEKFYKKRRSGSEQDTKIVGLAKMIGQKYIAKMGSMNIEISKVGRIKLMNVKNYVPGMYDDAFLEAVGKLNSVFQDFKGDFRFQELKIIIEFQRK